MIDYEGYVWFNLKDRINNNVDGELLAYSPYNDIKLVNKKELNDKLIHNAIKVLCMYSEFERKEVVYKGKTYKLSDMVSPCFADVHRQIKAGNVKELLAKGGRGSTKSSFISLMVPLLLMQNPKCHAVVLRKVANTLRHSVYSQVQWGIDQLQVNHLLFL